jgi:hypothetical protein
MKTKLIAYISRDNEEQIELLVNGALVAENAVTRAVLKFGGYVLDTNVDTNIIYFSSSTNQILCLKLGLIENLIVNDYLRGTLTLYDNVNTNGIA